MTLYGTCVPQPHYCPSFTALQLLCAWKCWHGQEIKFKLCSCKVQFFTIWVFPHGHDLWRQRGKSVPMRLRASPHLLISVAKGCRPSLIKVETCRCFSAVEGPSGQNIVEHTHLTVILWNKWLRIFALTPVRPGYTQKESQQPTAQRSPARAHN